MRAAKPAIERLNPRGQMFVLEYVLDWNPRRAALACGHPPNGASHWAARMLRSAVVMEAIEDEKKQRAERLRVDADAITKEYARLAFSNARDYWPTAGARVDLSKMDEDRSAAVKHFRFEEKENAETGEVLRRTEIELYDKKAALDSLAKASGMFIERHEHTLEARIIHMTQDEKEALIAEILEEGRRLKELLPAEELAALEEDLSDDERSPAPGDPG